MEKENKRAYHIWIEGDKGDGITVLWKIVDDVDGLEIPTWMFNNVLIKITFEEVDWDMKWKNEENGKGK